MLVSDMQEKTNKRRLITLLVLIAVTVLVWYALKPGNRVNIEEDLFQVESLETISAVTLGSDTGSVELAFNGTYWRVNDRYDADGDMIRVLFATLQQARPKRAVPEGERDSLFTALRGHGTRVSLYSEDGLEKEFFAGGNPAKTLAYFADPGTEEVYVMHIPGYRVYVSGI